MAIAQRFGTARDTFFTGMPENLLKHVCPPTFGGGPLDPVTPDRELRRDLLVGFDLQLPPNVAARLGTDRLPMWIIENDDPDLPETVPRRAYPSPLIRTVQGDVLHVRVGGKSGTHTIHWHGIEPTPVNDGVGKHSFEISGNFIYQFQTNEAGTYFYHCHKNTTLHFQMGLWGGLIVDPKNPNLPADNNLGLTFTALTPPYQTFGPGYVAGPRSFFGLSPGDAIPYHQERIWAVDSLDSAWHLANPNHNLNMQDCDANDPAGARTFYRFGSGEFDLNDFHPDVFTVTGVVLDAGSGPPFSGVISHPDIAINATVGQLVLIRYVNASYTIQELRLPVPATVIAWDGHPLGVPGFHQFGSPYTVPAGTPIRTTSARRCDLIIDTRNLPASQGFATLRLYDWVKGVTAAGLRAEIQIPVNLTGGGPQPGVDTVRITRARFNFNTRRGTGTLDLRAESDRAGVTLTASGTGFSNVELVRGRATIRNLTQSPFPVTVTSSGGGSATATGPI
ncbi:MAG: multicopper oxidase domain-containing protein [Syntrophobacterales bacterium]|nr:multicopper oxidase domain-containing protein [Syntrophobacterales bacterium]